MDAHKPIVPVIVGPTAVGKTAVALALAHLTPIRVISADSRQVYRGLDIGTAKPTPDQQRILPHDGIDIVDVGTRYSAGQFARDASVWVSATPNGRRPVVVGGTGLYIRALAEGLFAEPTMDHHRRARLREWLRSFPAAPRWAARLDPSYRGGGKQRASRAIEVSLLTGRPLSWWHQRTKSEGLVRPKYFFLTIPRPMLHERIRERVEAMVEQGLIDEVRAQLDRGVDRAAPGLDAVGYAEVVQFLAGTLPADQLVDAITTSTRRYAKRQETWFRNQLPDDAVTWLRAVDQPGKLAAQILEHLGRKQ